jgi:hypothetical protein
MVSGFLAGFSTQVALLAFTRQTSPTPTALPMRTTVDILAKDTFRRLDQALWGTASDGQQWGADANQSVIFSIASDTGKIAGGQGTFQAILGPQETDAEVVASGTVNHFDGQANFGVVLRWRDSRNWYKVFIDGTSLTMIRCVEGVITQIGRVSFTARDGISYTLRFRVVGRRLSAMVWPSNGREPTNWLIILSDTRLVSGHGGVRVLLQADTVINVASFLETSAGKG